MQWTIVLSLFFVTAAVLAATGRRLGRSSLVIGSLPFAAQLALVVASARRADSGAASETLDWLPSLGLSFVFRIDSLTLILSALVAGVGLLIVLYSGSYFGVGPKLTRFLAMLTLFSGGMAGLVSSDSLFGLFVFWEVTTVASYLLIGFDDTAVSARSAALQAALVTTLGGLAMLAGFVLLAAEAGSPLISDLVADPPTGGIVTVALVLVFAGAFTKSAQVPFHFWLPGAMAAPTPASAYLHSATMVKAGVILLMLLAPAFAGAPVWAPVVTTVGLVTMAWGALRARRQHDLKLLLAHGTVSQLGFMVALIGLDLVPAALAVLVGHGIFKAGLFLVVGALDKSAGTRDIRVLAERHHRDARLATWAGLLAASMAGLPPLLGFVTKEAAFDALVADRAWVPLAVMAAASIVTVLYAVRFWWGGFGRSLSVPNAEAGRAKRPLEAIVGVLATASLLIGLAPTWLANVIADTTGGSVKLVLWPGFTPALAVSGAVLAIGAVGGLIDVRRAERRSPLRVRSADEVYQSILDGLSSLAGRVTGVVQNGSLPVYLAVIFSTVVAIPLMVWATTWNTPLDVRVTNGWAEVALGSVAVAGAIAAARVRRRLAAVLMLGVVGYSVAGIYVAFGAPDVALTQVLVETLTVALFAMVLVRLPRQFSSDPESLSRRTRLLVAGLVGIFAATAGIAITSASPDRSISAAYIANAEASGGTNVVNIILTNFRALDTLGEITVLAAAALGISALVGGRRRVSDPVEVEESDGAKAGAG